MKYLIVVDMQNDFITGVVKKIKTYERQIQMTTGDLIPIDMIFDIKGDIFGSLE